MGGKLYKIADLIAIWEEASVQSLFKGIHFFLVIRNKSRGVSVTFVLVTALIFLFISITFSIGYILTQVNNKQPLKKIQYEACSV